MREPGEVCDDGNVVDGDCCSAACTAEPPDGSPCTDQDACTDRDACQGGRCVGTPVPGCPPACTSAAECDDQNPCTVDTCDAQRGCQHQAGNAGALCRAAAGPCDMPETCSGADPACPGDGFA